MLGGDEICAIFPTPVNSDQAQSTPVTGLRTFDYSRSRSAKFSLGFMHHHRPILPNTPPTFVSGREKARIAELEKEVENLHSQLETALAHAVCASWKIRSLQECLNSKSKTKKRKVQVNAQYISSVEAIRILDEQERADAEKRQREEEAQAAKKVKDDQRKQQCEAGGITFSGSLNNKTKDDLLDITFALKLTGSDSNMQETKAALVSMINGHLDANPGLTSDPAFSGLFLSRSRGCRRNANGEDATSATLPSTPLPPGLPCQLLPSNLAGNISEREPEPPLVLFGKLPHAGRFFQAINSTHPDFSHLHPSSFAPYTHYPPPIPQFADPQFSPSYFAPPQWPAYG